MSEADIHHPHDGLFKAGFRDISNAAALFQWQLPQAIASQIDWTGLKLEASSFVDSHFRQSESDLLFSAPIADTRCFLYILFEHQSEEDPLMALRFLRYMLRIWEQHIKQHDEKTRLPLIIPIVLAQNAKPSKTSPNFLPLLDIPQRLEHDLRPYIPDFFFHLIQLAEIPFESIRGTPAGIMILRTMKAERVAALLSDPVWDEAMLIQVPREIFELLVRYMLNAELDTSQFHHRVSHIQQSELRSTTMTLADRLIQEGRQEGIQENILEVLELRFNTIPDGLREEILSIHDLNHLRRLHRSAILASSIEEFSNAL